MEMSILTAYVLIIKMADTNSPFRLVDYRAMTEQLDRNDYVIV